MPEQNHRDLLKEVLNEGLERTRLWFGKERKKETLDEFLRCQLVGRQRKRIDACVDMWEPFRLSLEEWAPQYGEQTNAEAPANVWTQRGAHMLLQILTRLLNDEWEDTFRRWYPGFRSQTEEQPVKKAACPSGTLGIECSPIQGKRRAERFYSRGRRTPSPV